MVNNPIKLKKLNQNQRKLLTQPFSVALMATALSSWGGGGGTNFNYNIFGSSNQSTSSTQTFDVLTFGLTNDPTSISLNPNPDNLLINLGLDIQELIQVVEMRLLALHTKRELQDIPFPKLILK